MVTEVSAALTWTLDNIHVWGGDPSAVCAMGHSAGAHLVALALMKRAGLPIGPPGAQAPSPVTAPLEQSFAQTHPPATASCGAWQPPPAFTSDMLSHAACDARQPACFLGVAGVYDIGKHWEHERSRGVEYLSMMSRAMGGRAQFPCLSPAVILHHVADVLQAARDEPSPRDDSAAVATSSLGPLVLPLPHTPVGWFESFTLIGQAIPHRAGLVPTSVADHFSLQPASPTQPVDADVPNQARLSAAGPYDAADASQQEIPMRLQRAVQRLPPCYLMMGCADGVVPWHEGAEMAAALTRCKVPTQHLIYQHADHTSFTLDWKPLRAVRTTRTTTADVVPQHAAAALPSAPQQLAQVWPGDADLAPWAKDMVRVARLQQQRATGCSSPSPVRSVNKGG